MAHSGNQTVSRPPQRSGNSFFSSLSPSPTGFTPRSAQPNDIIGFFKTARGAGNTLVWAGDWKEFEYARGFPTLLVEQCYLDKLTLVIEATAFSQSGGKLLRNLDEKTLQKYVSGAADFDKFVKLFDRTCDAAKAVSPDTKIFTVFQLEKMNGLNGGLYGGTDDPSKNLWFLLDKFSGSDFIAFNTYPGMIYKTPFEIPADYFTEIKSHTDKPLAIGGTGWQSAEGTTGWQGSEAQQAEYVQAFLWRTRDLIFEFTAWSYLYDPTALAEPFNSMGLLRGDGMPRWAWYGWSAGR